MTVREKITRDNKINTRDNKIKWELKTDNRIKVYLAFPN